VVSNRTGREILVVPLSANAQAGSATANTTIAAAAAAADSADSSGLNLEELQQDIARLELDDHKAESKSAAPASAVPVTPKAVRYAVR